MIPVINSINISFTNFKYCEKSFVNITNYFLNEQSLTKAKKINRHSDSQIAVLTENLSFNYDPDKNVLKKISIKVPFQKDWNYRQFGIRKNNTNRLDDAIFRPKQWFNILQ